MGLVPFAKSQHSCMVRNITTSTTNPTAVSNLPSQPLAAFPLAIILHLLYVQVPACNSPINILAQSLLLRQQNSTAAYYYSPLSGRWLPCLPATTPQASTDLAPFRSLNSVDLLLSAPRSNTMETDVAQRSHSRSRSTQLQTAPRNLAQVCLLLHSQLSRHPLASAADAQFSDPNVEQPLRTPLGYGEGASHHQPKTGVSRNRVQSNICLRPLCKFPSYAKPMHAVVFGGRGVCRY